MGKFLVKESKAGLRFNLVANNGEVIAASQVYKSASGCKNGIASVAKNAPVAVIEDQTVEGFKVEKHPKFEVYADKAGEFRFRLPDKKTLGNNAIGGLTMGFGASIAGGCTIGNGLVNSAIFTWQGWAAILFFLLGTYIAVYFTIIRPNKKANSSTINSEAATS